MQNFTSLFSDDRSLSILREDGISNVYLLTLRYRLLPLLLSLLLVCVVCPI